jgi:hypothetical protein
MGGDLYQRACERGFRSGLLHHHRLGIVSLVVAVCLASPGCSSKPDGVDVKPITSLRFTAGPDFLEGIQRHLGGNAADWSKNGVGYLVFQPPNPDPDHRIFRSVNVFREESLLKAQEIYADQRQQFTGLDWKLYLEQGDAAEKWFISYKGTRFDTNHGMPVWVNTKPEIFIGILKQNVFIVISYTAYASSSGYIQTINKDVRYVADLLPKAALSTGSRPKPD